MSTSNASIPVPRSDSVAVPSTQLVIDALLREYMKRKGMKAALAAFDAENPRDETSISQLSVLVNGLSATPLPGAPERGVDGSLRTPSSAHESLVELMRSSYHPAIR